MSRGGGLAAGLATFNSCNKAGSIPHFTKHLQSNPTDYNALMWRGRAHSIVGNISSARADFIAAGINSSGARRYVAQYFEASMNQDGAESIKILNEAVGRYPDNPLVLGEIGTVFYMNNQYTNALPILEKTVWLLEQGGAIEEPSYCWHKHNIGSIRLQNNQLDAAERAFADALNFSETHTVSHIGYAQVQLAKRREDIARRHYNRARHLNPTLVTWETFEAFKAAVQPAQPATWFETFKNLPWTLGNMALSAVGMTGTSQPAPAPTRTSSSTRPASANQPNYRHGANRSALQASANQSTSRASTNQSSHTTSANQSSYGTSSNKPTYRPTYTSSPNQSTYKPASNSSTYSSSSSQQTNRPSSQTNSSYTHSGRSTSQSASRPRTAPSASNRDSFSTYRSESQTTPQNYQLTSSSANRASFTSTPAESRQYSTPTGSRPYSTDTFSRAGGVGSNDNVTTIEAAKNSRANRQNASQAAGTSRSSGASNMAGGSRRSGGGSGNGGDGGGSDDDDDASNDAWKRIRKLSKEILKYGGKEYVLSEDEKFYYSRDKAGHGSSYLKMYHNKKNRLEFIGSLNRNFDLLEGKHESREGTSIRKADMDVVRRR